MQSLILIKKVNWWLFLPAVFLTGMGLLSIYSASIRQGNFLDLKKQLIFFAISIIVFFIASFLDLRALKANSSLVLTLYIISLGLLLGLFFFSSQTRGIRGWYKLGPVSFDPVPFSALILIIVLSKFFSQRHIEIKRFRLIIFSGLYALLPAILIFLQPDLGSALTLLAVWLGIIIFSGIGFKHFLILSLLVLILFGLFFQFWLKDYQKQRLVSFLNPQADKQGASWSVNQSKIAIGSGGFWGKGLKQGWQTQYGFLPEPKTDFIFSAIAEELGFIGVFFLLSALLLLFYRITKIAFLAKNNFTKLFASGFAFLFLSQSFINIGMCLGLFPVVGIPLPFVSYGGSQLLAFYLSLGILASLETKS